MYGTTFATANHFVIDGVAGSLVALAGLAGTAYLAKGSSA